MSPIQLEAIVKNLNNRVDRIEQILPTLATTRDLLATKQDVLATQRDVLETRQDVLAVKQDVLAVKQDVLAVQRDVLDTRETLMTAIAELRGQMLKLHEDNKSDNRLLAEHLAGVMQHLDRLEQRSFPPPA